MFNRQHVSDAATQHVTTYEDVCVSAPLRSHLDSGCNLFIVQQVEEAV